MRVIQRFVVAAVTLLIAYGVSAEEFILSGYDAFQARQKATCGTTEAGQTRYGIFEGRSYSRIATEKDRHIFTVLGINVRQCDVVDDPVRGKGFRSVSREIMVYMDPETGEVLDTWTNPWTGEDVKVLHVANDPVNMRDYRYEKDADGNVAGPWTLRVYGDTAASSAEIPLFYPNPLAGDYQAYVGNMYHAMEIFNTFYDVKRLASTRRASVGDTHMSWSRVAQWLPWMKMGDMPGLMVFNTTGYSTFDEDKIPAKLRAILDERFALYRTPPPRDDKRPNETSWTVFKKYVESQQAAD